MNRVRRDEREGQRESGREPREARCHVAESREVKLRSEPTAYHVFRVGPSHVDDTHEPRTKRGVLHSCNGATAGAGFRAKDCHRWCREPVPAPRDLSLSQSIVPSVETVCRVIVTAVEVAGTVRGEQGGHTTGSVSPLHSPGKMRSRSGDPSDSRADPTFFFFRHAVRWQRPRVGFPPRVAALRRRCYCDGCSSTLC
ncbi:hypothetical protein MRX96_046124 [Rhipicephalus microplus]